MAEREDSICELDSISDQDPNKPDDSGTSHNNRANHLENSSDVVVEDDGLNDYSELNVNVVAGSWNVSPKLSTMVDDQGIELGSQTGKSEVVDGDESVMMFGQFRCSISFGVMKHASSFEDGDRLQVIFAKSLENKDAYNDDESRIVLETKDVEDKENLVQTENEGIGDDDDDGALFDKNVVAESSIVPPQPVTMVDEQDIELDSQNENLDFVDVKVSEPLNGAENGNVMRLDSHEEFPSLRSNSRKIISDVPIMSLPEHSSRFDVNNDNESRIALKIADVEDMVDQSDKATGCCKENLFQKANEQTKMCESKDTYVAPIVACSVDVLDGEKVTDTKPFNYLIKIPRSDDETLREQIGLAKLNLDGKMKLRNAIQVQIKEKKRNIQNEYEFAKGEVRSARELVKSKNMEIDPLLSVINKAKIALTFEDINSQIRDMNYQIQHNTITLKEEKQLIHEIKHLKQLGQQLPSNMGSQDEIKQALEQREEAEDRLKILRKDLNILRNSLFKAEAIAAEAKKKYDDENQNVRELQAQYRAADGVCQAAYAQWQKLRKELSKKSNHFFKYKDDATIASDYAVSRNTDALYPLCMNQVESFMKQWNTNEEYRRDYARLNARSTLRRFGTLDGRGLGPDEKPPLLPSKMATTQLKVDVASSQIPNAEQKQETSNGNVSLDCKSVKKDETVAVSKEVDEVESLRKEEEMRAKSKEELGLEEMAKSNEARERKKRQAQKLQRSQEWKAQKEAEERDKVKQVINNLTAELYHKLQKREKRQKKKAALNMMNKKDEETYSSSDKPCKMQQWMMWLTHHNLLYIASLLYLPFLLLLLSLNHLTTFH